MARGPQRGAASPQNIARAVSRRMNTPVLPADRFALDITPGIPLVDLDRHGFHGCRWPVNAAAPGEQHLFCGEPSDLGRSYCSEHCQRAGAGYWNVRAA